MDTPTITRPSRFVTRMGFFLVAVGVVLFFLFPPLEGAFLSNPALNGTILGVALLGIIFNFRQTLMLWPEVHWIEGFHRGGAQLSNRKPPRLLSPMVGVLRERKGDIRLSPAATRSILDGIGSRLDESRDISRYLMGLLIFLGLLGTFWGLLQTVGAVADVVGSLQVSGGDLASVFGELKRGLEAPLSGMGTAFSSSLFGLGGSLILGFLDLQTGQAQNRFYNDLEDWLTEITRISTAGPLSEGEQAIPAYIEALLENTAESLQELQRTIAHGESSRNQTDANVVRLTEHLGSMTEQMSSEIRLLAKTIAALAQKQDR